MLNYRIHIKELKEKVFAYPDPEGYETRRFKDNEKERQQWLKLFNNVFPERTFFKQTKDFEKLFINDTYFNPKNIFVAIEKETNKMVGFFGYQTLRNFVPPSADMLYMGIEKEHRQKGLLKVVCGNIYNQLIDQGV